PENVWRLQSELNSDWRRVAVLPLTAANGLNLDEDTCRMLQDALRLELARGGQFEVTEVPGTRLQSWIGQRQVRAQDSVPASLLPALKDNLAADLVLFVEITEFSAYGPLRVGWHLKLMSTSDACPVWEADHLFDSAQPAVARGAEQHDRKTAGKSQF